MFGRVSIQWQAKLSPGTTSATSEEISILSTQLVETSGIVTFQSGDTVTNFSLSLKQDTVLSTRANEYILSVTVRRYYTAYSSARSV